MKTSVLVLLLLAAILMTMSSLPAQADTCASSLLPHDQVVSTLRELFANQTLTVTDLVAVRNGVNPLDTRFDTNSDMFRPVVKECIQWLKVNTQAQIELERFIASLQTNVEKQAQQTTSTKNVFLRMEFHELPKGSFMFGKFTRSEKPRKVKIKRNFSMANMPVTQWQYSMVMKNNPSLHASGPESQVILIDGKPIQMQPNNPVEQVSWLDIKNFIGRLNELSKKDDPLIYRIVAKHKRFAKFRLPYEVEWEYFESNLGQWDGYPWSRSEACRYAWFDQSGGTTRPVCELAPVRINNHPFYDIAGNVPTFLQDRDDKDMWWPERILMNYLDRQEGRRPDRVIRGTGYRDKPVEFDSRHSRQEDYGSFDLGFWLVEGSR